MSSIYKGEKNPEMWKRLESDKYSPQLKYWMCIVHYDTIEDGQNKKSHLLFSFLVRIVLFLHFSREIYLSKIFFRHFVGFIWIITPLMKINVSIQETKIILAFVMRVNSVSVQMRYVVFMRVKYASTQCNCWMCYQSWSSNGWAKFSSWPEPIKFLVDMLNHTHSN